MDSEDKIKNNDTSIGNIDKPTYLDKIDAIDYLIFQETGVLAQFQRKYIPMEAGDTVTSIFIPSKNNSKRTFYIGHGFGGSSLMYFPSFRHLLQKGNILIWETRGMGLGIKKDRQQVADAQINAYYTEGLEKILEYYQHEQIVFLCHSLSAYIVMRLLLERPYFKSIEKLIFLSPVGFTPKAQDRNNSIKSCSDIGSTLLAKFGWKFNLTFKSPLRTICSCMKKKLLTGGFNDFPMTAREKQLMVQLFLALVGLPDGSENIFFRYFQPRVLPPEGQSIWEKLGTKTDKFQYEMSAYFGGKQDWVDKTGITMMADKFQNIKIHTIQECSHMVLMNFPKLRQIIDAEFTH